MIATTPPPTTPPPTTAPPVTTPAPPSTTTTTTTTTTPSPTATSYDMLFTSSSVVINVSSSGSNFRTNQTSGDNPTITLSANTNHDLIVNTSIPFAIRNSAFDYSSISNMYGNNAMSGITSGTIMWTPTSTGSLCYVYTVTPAVSGTINII